MTEEEDALQQALQDSFAGTPYSPEKFPGKSYYWLKEYQLQLESRLELMKEQENEGGS